MKVSALLKGTMVIIHDLLFVVIKAAILLLAEGQYPYVIRLLS